jgi:hypothetical protein
VIDPHWLLEDLDPRTWRAIGRYFMPSQYIMAAQPGERGLFILHDGGQQPRAVDSQLGPRTDLPLAGLSDPRRLAQDLLADGEWDRVHVIDRRHLEHVARESQSAPRRELTLDEYYHLVYELIWDGSTGYVCEPPHPGNWHGWTYARLREMARQLPSPCALALCVLEDAQVEIGLVLGVRDGRIVRVTTLEGLPPLAVRPSVSDSFVARVWSAVEAAVAPPAAVLVCTRAAFAEWIVAPDKGASLARAIDNGTAALRADEQLSRAARV